MHDFVRVLVRSYSSLLDATCELGATKYGKSLYHNHGFVGSFAIERVSSWEGRDGGSGGRWKIDRD